MHIYIYMHIYIHIYIFIYIYVCRYTYIDNACVVVCVCDFLQQKIRGSLLAVWPPDQRKFVSSLASGQRKFVSSLAFGQPKFVSSLAPGPAEVC